MLSAKNARYYSAIGGESLDKRLNSTIAKNEINRLCVNSKPGFRSGEDQAVFDFRNFRSFTFSLLTNEVSIYKDYAQFRLAVRKFQKLHYDSIFVFEKKRPKLS